MDDSEDRKVDAFIHTLLSSGVPFTIEETDDPDVVRIRGQIAEEDRDDQ
jgi:hypothetical protein